MRRLSTIDRSKLAVAALALAVVLFFCVNIFSNATFSAARLDLTEGKLFTLSKGTAKVLAGIDEPITLRLYYSQGLGDRSPRHATYFGRVHELLDRYATMAKGKIKLEVLNPEPFSDAEDRAVAAGLQGLPLNNAGDLGYFGLAGTNSTDDRAVIPFFTPSRESFLEYDLTKMVYTLAHPAKKVVGLLTKLPIDGGAMRPPFQPSPAWAVMDQVGEFFEVRPLPLDIRGIDPEVDILMVVHPKDLNEHTLYAIDQFVLRGGRLLVFVDSDAEVDAQNARGMPGGKRSDFDRLLKAWGVKLSKGVAGDLDAARRVNVRQGQKMTVVDHVTWLTLKKPNFDAKDVVTGDLSAVNVASAGYLEPTGAEGVTVEPLMTTGPRSMGIAADKFQFQPDVVALFRDFKPSGKKLTLAARIEGEVKTAFPDGPPPEESKEARAKDQRAKHHIAKASKPVNLIVVADVDMLTDQLWADQQNLMGRRLLVPYANNADFVVNALDNLGGSDALIGLRGRAESNRPFTMVQDIRQAAERKFRAREKDLQSKLETAQKKLERLERRRGAEGDLVISTEDRASIDKLRGEMIAIRKDLRNVQHALRVDIERLDALLKFLNIAAIPLLLGLGTLVVTVIGRARRRRRSLPV